MRGRHLRNRRACIEPAAQRADGSDAQRPLPAEQRDHLRALVDQREIRDVHVLLHQHAAPVPVGCDLNDLLRGRDRVLLLRDECLRRLQRRDELRVPASASSTVLYSPIATSACATSAPSFAFSRPRSKIGSEIAGPMEPASASRENSDAGVSANTPPSATRFTSG